MKIIKVFDLEKRFGERVVVDQLNLEIEEGELFALLGTNGAGKTTTIRLLSGLLLPSRGTIEIDGKDRIRQSQQIKELINLSPQETAVAPNLSVRENLEFMAGVYAVAGKKEKASELIERFQLTEIANQKVKTLSGGWQRRLSIAMALVNDPKVLFLDEPTLGLDVLARRELWKIIEELKGKVTIILTTHYMEEAEHLSDHIGIMAAGKLVYQGTATKMMEEAGVDNFEEAYVLLATGGNIE